jgi:H+-translocating NAD(P) transhydrogenase subunit alpha
VVATIFIPQERAPGERRVAATPASIGKLRRTGIEVAVESGAGAHARIRDDDYVAAGARVAEAPASPTRR